MLGLAKNFISIYICFAFVFLLIVESIVIIQIFVVEH